MNQKLKGIMEKTFGFCKRWTEIGGKCYLYITDDMTHVGEYRYTGNLLVDMTNNLKKID